MADQKISALTAVTTLTGASELAVNEGGTSKKATVSQLINNTHVVGQVACKHVTTDHSVASATQTEVVDLAVTLAAGTYVFKYWLVAQTSSAGVGLTFALNYTGVATAITYMLMWPDASATAATGVVDDSANAATGQVVGQNVSRAEGTTTATISTGTGGASTANVDLFLTIEGVLVASDGGDLELWHGSEVSAATRVEGPGSSLVITRTN
jgi:hypothetical protein